MKIMFRGGALNNQKIGLALSGGGSRAIAFHLGCMRALHDRGILDKVSVLSAVSGGSVIAALYAYNAEPFDEFERRVVSLLQSGIAGGIAKETFFSTEFPKILLANLLGGLCAIVGRMIGFCALCFRLFGIDCSWFAKISNSLLDIFPRFASRTTAFERYLEAKHFGSRLMDSVAKDDLVVVINAAELRTETAFRFGSLESGCWRFGRTTEKPKVATAVAASAAFPAMLPAIDRRLEFCKKGNFSLKCFIAALVAVLQATIKASIPCFSKRYLVILSHLFRISSTVFYWDR